MARDEHDPINDKPMPLLEHLIELRRRLIWSMVAFMAAFLVCYHFLRRSTASSPARWWTSWSTSPAPRGG